MHSPDITIPHADGKAPGKSKSARQAFDKVASLIHDELPWLTTKEIKKLCEQQDAEYETGQSDPVSVAVRSHFRLEDAAIDLDDLAVTVAQEIRDKRETYQEDLLDDSHFYVKLLQGRWTKLATGAAADGAACKPRAHAKDWARRYWGQLSKSFMFAAYGEAAALKLARGWAHKSEWFFDRHLVSQSMDGYMEPEEWQQWAATISHDSLTFSRISELRSFAPRVME